MATFKTLIMQKWQILLRAGKIESVVHLLYCLRSIGCSYNQMLCAEVRDDTSNMRRLRIYVHGI